MSPDRILGRGSFCSRLRGECHDEASAPPLLLALSSPPAACAGRRARTPAAAGSRGRGRAVVRAAEPAQDPHSFAHPEEVAVEHLKLDLTVDFPSGSSPAAPACACRTRPAPTSLILDTRDLDIRRVTLDDGKTEARFTLGDAVEAPRPAAGDRDHAPAPRWVNVDYSTKPEAAALQWLTPEQAGSPLAVPLHAVGVDPRPHLGPLPGHPRRAHDLRGHDPRAARA